MQWAPEGIVKVAWSWEHGRPNGVDQEMILCLQVLPGRSHRSAKDLGRWPYSYFCFFLPSLFCVNAGREPGREACGSPFWDLKEKALT